MDFCYDEEGYNPLHRAVIGGNYDGFEYLIDNGMSVNVKTKNGRDILDLVIQHAPCTPGYHDYMKGITDVDLLRSRKYKEIASYVAKHTRLIKDRTPMQICNRNTETLSLSHLAAAKGLMEVLEAIKEVHGETYFNCSNYNNISTAFLLGFFGHSSLHLTEIQYSKRLSHSYAALYTKLALDFKTFVYPKGSVLWKCRHRVSNFRNTIPLLNCASKTNEEFLVLYIQSLKLTGVTSRDHYDKMLKQYGLHNINLSEKSDFDCAVREVRKYLKNPKRYKYKYLLEYKNLDYSYREFNCNMKRNASSKTCLTVISQKTILKRKAHRIFIHIGFRAFLSLIELLYEQELFEPFQFPIEIEVISDISHRIIYLSYLLYSINEFHSVKKYEFWDVLRNNGDTKGRKMVHAILNTPISEIRKWRGSVQSRRMSRNYLPSDEPLQKYVQNP
jgi:ankyrin repeat protein